MKTILKLSHFSFFILLVLGLLVSFNASANILPVPLAPTDTISKTSPRFYWTLIPGIDRYSIRIWSRGNIIFDEATTDALSCNDNFCSFRKLGSSFQNGPYTWRVRTIAASGLAGSWSKSQSFVVDTAYLPSAPITPLAPNDVINTAYPTFVWTPVAGINKYAIRVLDSQGNVIFSGVTSNDFICTEGLCTYVRSNRTRPFWSMPDGSASWQIRTEADNGVDGEWSDLLDFSVDTIQSKIPEQLYPKGDIYSGTSHFFWKKLKYRNLSYSKYAIRILDSNGTVILSKVTPFDFSCPNDICFYNAESVGLLTSGSWQIRTELPDGPWSAPLDFNVITDSSYTPQPISPTGIIYNPAVLFKWGAVADESYKYALRVLDSSGAVIFNRITPTSLDCTGGVCSSYGYASLPQEEVLSWTVRTEGADGTNDPVSAPQYFEIGYQDINSEPTAVITPSDQNIYQMGNSITFYGDQSSDPEQVPLTYQWQLLNRPLNSATEITHDPSLSFARFSPDVYGTYLLSLTVNDSFQDSTVAYTVIELETPPTIPTINTFTSDLEEIQLGQSVQFEIDVTDINNDNVTCYLDLFGNNKTIERIDSCQNRTVLFDYTYAQAGKYTPRLVVTDGNHNPAVASSSADIITVDGSIVITSSRPLQLSSDIPEISFIFDATSDHEIKSAKVRILDARIIDNEVALDLADPRNIKGTLWVGDTLPTGNYIAEFIVEDVFGTKAFAYSTFYFEQTLKLISNLPNSGTVVNNSAITVDATCIFDAGDCQIKVLINTSPAFELTATNQLSPTEIDLSPYISGSYTVTVTAEIQTPFLEDQELTQSSTFFVENSDKLALVKSVPGKILDANESKILYLLPKDTVGDNLYIYDRVSETTTTIELPEGVTVATTNRSYLTPTGAFFRTSTYKEWHQDNGLIDYPDIYYGPKLSGNYVVWARQDKSLWLKQFSTGSIEQIGTDVGATYGGSYDVASNGVVAYLSYNNLMKYDANTGATETLVIGDSTGVFNMAGIKTDGSNYVYLIWDYYELCCYPELQHFDGTYKRYITTLDYEYGAYYLIKNGRVSYSFGYDIQVWTPTSNQRRTDWGNTYPPMVLESFGDNGDVIFIRYDRATRIYERYLSSESDSLNPPIIHVNQSGSRSLQIDGIWHVIIGDSLFQVKRPPVTVTAQVPLYLTVDQGSLWDTTESVSRIATVFTEEEIETTFITLNDILHAYKDWIEVDAPYASAHTKNSYSEYVLELEFKWGTKKFNPRLTLPKDAGIMFHIYGPNNTPWPSGLEYQLKQPDQYGGFVAVRTRAKVTHTDGIYDEAALPVQVGREVGTEHIDINIIGTINPDWNAVRLEVTGDSGVYYFNGEKVMEFTDAEYYDHNKQLWFPLTHGRIILQAEGAEIEYRNVTLSPLMP